MSDDLRLYHEIAAACGLWSALLCLWAPFALSDIRTRLRNQLVRHYSLDVHLAVEEGVTASLSQL